MRNSNIRTVISFEITRTLRSKSFWIGALFGPLLIGVLGVVIGLSNMSTQESLEEQSEQVFTFEYVDHSGIVNHAVAEASGGTEIADPAQGLAHVMSGKVEAFFEYPADLVNEDIIVSAQDAGLLESQKYTAVASAILHASAIGDLNDPNIAPIVNGQYSLSITTYKDGTETPGIWGVVAPLALVVIFFLIIVMQGNRMLTATLEEKENRVTEMILTTIGPTQLISGKMIALGVIGIVQILAIIIPTVIVVMILQATSVMPNIDLSRIVVDPLTTALAFLLMIVSLLLFTATLMAIGAAMPTLKDASAWFSAVIILLVCPLYVVMWMLTNPDAAIVGVFTYFPWTAPITSMLRLAFGVLPWWQALILVVWLSVVTFIVFRIASRLFQYGSVAYGKKLDVRAALTTKV